MACLCYLCIFISGCYTLKYLREHPWLLSLVLIFLIAGPGFFRLEQINNKTNSIVKCINDWADASINRSVILTDALADRNEILDKVLRAASGADREELIKDLNDYKVASDKYKELVKSNPIPRSPKLICN